MTKAKIDAIVGAEEGPKLEFKTKGFLSSSPHDIAKQFVGLANRGGGRLAIGINDEGEIAGDDFDVDSVLNHISSISRMRCSPGVDFEYEFSSTDEGDVLLLEIEPRDELPHAVVERSDAEIAERTYYLRTKNSTRYVSDSELKWLFNSGPDVDFTYETRWWHVYHIESHGVPKIELPEVNTYILPLIDLEGENSEVLDEIQSISQYVIEIAPFLFITGLCHRHGPSWKSELKLSSSGYAIDGDKSVPRSKYYVDDVEINGLQDTILASTNIDIQESIVGFSFSTIEGVHFEIDLHPSDPRRSRIVISKEDAFEFEINFRFSAHLPSIPPNHPEGPEKAEVEEDPYRHVELDISFESDFAFPEERDPNISLHQAYANSIVDAIKDYWSVEELLRDMPNSKLYTIENKVDLLLDGLGLNHSEMYR